MLRTLFIAALSVIAIAAQKNPSNVGPIAYQDLRYRLIGQGGINQHALLDQLHPLQARMPVLADDDVIVHGNAERVRDVDDCFRHLDIYLRRRPGCGSVLEAVRQKNS